MSLNDIVDIEKSDEIYSITFVADDFQIISMKDSRSTLIINGALSEYWY